MRVAYVTPPPTHMPPLTAPGHPVAEAAPRATPWRPTATQLAIALTVLGGVLRFATLNVSSIELDESATLALVHRGFSGMLSHLSQSESTPPLYYIFVWAWTKVFGAGPIGFRSMSALIGTITIPVMYLAGREISPRAGVWAAILTTVSPSMFFFSQQARAYGLLVLLSAAAFVAWERALRTPSTRHLALWSALSGLALLAHYFAAFLFIAEAVVLIVRLGWRRVALPIGAVVIVGLALAPLAIHQRAEGKTNWIEQQSLPRRIAESMKIFTVGAYGPLVLFALALSLLLVGCAIVLVARRGTRSERSGARDAAIVAAGAIVLPLLLAATHLVDVYDGRNMLAFFVPFAVLVAAGLGAARAPRAGALLGAVLCAIYVTMIVAANAIPDYQRDNWRGVAHSLGRPTRSRLIVAEAFSAGPLSIYMGKLSDAAASVPAVREVDFVALRHLRTVGPPQAAVVPRVAPAGFRLAGITTTESFAIARFVAASAVAPKASELAHLSGIGDIEPILQR
jgi:mannosyltransferase